MNHVDQSVGEDTSSTPDAPKRVVAIVGMHRSGTSSLAGSMQTAGLFLGKAHTWNRHNHKGNRENPDVVELNDAVLADNGGAWNEPVEPVIWSEERQAQGRAILKSYADHDTWGFKDPRSLLTIKGWLALTPIHFVGTFRHPNSVVESLTARDHALDPRFPMQLWNEYNRRLIALYDAEPFPIVSFDLPVDDYQIKVNEAAVAIGLQPIPADNPFFTPDLRSRNAAKIVDATPLPPDTAELYARLQEIAL